MDRPLLPHQAPSQSLFASSSSSLRRIPRHLLPILRVPDHFEPQMPALVHPEDPEPPQQDLSLPGLDPSIQRRLPLKKVGRSTRNCVMCLEEFAKEEVIQVLPCSHYFHQGCLRPWFEGNTHCPLCRLDLKKFFEEDE